MDWVTRLPVWLMALALAGIAVAFIYVAIAKPPNFKFAGLEFGTTGPATQPGNSPKLNLTTKIKVTSFSPELPRYQIINTDKCPSGSTVIAGGYMNSVHPRDAKGLNVTHSGPANSVTNWRVSVRNDTNRTFDLEVWAVCLKVG